MKDQAVLNLISQAQSDDAGQSRRALDQLILRFNRYIRAKISQYITDPNDLDDVFQNVCLLIAGKIKSVNKPTGFTSWVATIVFLQAIDFLRKKKRHRKIESRPDMEREIDPKPDPLDRIILVEQIEILLRKVDQLPPTRRTAIGTYYLGWPLPEKYRGEGRNITLSTSRHYGLKQLRKKLN